MDVRFIYVTTQDEEEAVNIGEGLLRERLVACVNVVPGVTSMYWWEGRIQKDHEVLLVAKTTRERVAEVIRAVKSMHRYDCPCVVSLPVEDGNPEFLEWVEKETGTG